MEEEIKNKNCYGSEEMVMVKSAWSRCWRGKESVLIKICKTAMSDRWDTKQVSQLAGCRQSMANVEKYSPK